MFCCAQVSCGRSSDSEIAGSSKNINGVTARFTVKMTWTKRIKFMAVYRNNSSQTVHFRVVPPSYDARFWLGNSEETGCILVTEATIIDLVLQPGQERRIPDELTPGNCFKPGTYEVRFYYNLRLLPPDFKRTLLPSIWNAACALVEPAPQTRDEIMWELRLTAPSGSFVSPKERLREKGVRLGLHWIDRPWAAVEAQSSKSEMLTHVQSIHSSCWRVCSESRDLAFN